MGLSPGCLVAVKVMIRGRGIYISSTVSLLLLYYSVFVKNPQVMDLLILMSVLNVLTAVLSDSDGHNTLFYTLRISGAKPSTVTAYIVTVSVLVSLISSVPVAVGGDFFKELLVLTVDVSSSVALLHLTHLRIKKHLTSLTSW